jgi:sugar phosphate isomerase/epimerase
MASCPNATAIGGIPALLEPLPRTPAQAGHDALAMQIGLQLYSVKEACASDLDGTVAAVAGMGYAGVEPWNLHDRSAAEWKRLLDANGLVACGWHVQLDRLEQEPVAVVEDARTLGLTRVIVPSAPWPDTLAGVDEAVDRIARVAERLGGDGIAVGFHNHGRELEPREGVTPLERLAAVPGLFLQLDVGWAYRAGADPVALLREHAGRCPTIHIKDEAGRNGPSRTVGEGVVPIREVVAAARETGVEWLVVEQEDFEDETPLEAVDRCYASLSLIAG